MRRINLEALKELHLKGNVITFDIVRHMRIPNYVLSNGSLIGIGTLQTINAFQNWKSKQICN